MFSMDILSPTAPLTAMLARNGFTPAQAVRVASANPTEVVSTIRKSLRDGMSPSDALQFARGIFIDILV